MPRQVRIQHPGAAGLDRAEPDNRRAQHGEPGTGSDGIELVKVPQIEET